MGFYIKQEVPYSLTGDGSSNNGSDIELITLNAVENKTYNAPNNKAYNKVTVNVPNVLPIAENFNNIVFQLTGKKLYNDPTNPADNSDSTIPILLSFNSSTNKLSYAINEEEDTINIDDLDGWYIVEGKTLLDTIASNIYGFPNPNVNDITEESIESGEQYIDVIIQCPVKINNTEIYLIHIFKFVLEEEDPEPEE